MRFLVLYAGRTLSDARLVSVSSDRGLVREVAGRMLDDLPATKDPALLPLEEGRKAALSAIAGRKGGK
jgi:hypothetical protein